MARIICEKPPVPLSSIDRRFGGDLETVVLKALAKDRTKRYQSAAEFAKDIQRYLDREPVEARPPTVWNMVLRWMARHPIASASIASAIIAVCIVGASVVSVWRYTKVPNSLEVAAGRREVRLLSAIDTPIHTWHSFGAEFSPDALLVQRPLPW
jgi:hypothetical protein